MDAAEGFHEEGALREEALVRCCLTLASLDEPERRPSSFPSRRSLSPASHSRRLSLPSSAAPSGGGIYVFKS